MAPEAAKPVDVLTKSAPADSVTWQARIFSSSVRYAFSKITFTIAPPAWATSTTARMSCPRLCRGADLSAPMLSTMSISRAPCSSARRVSNTFVSVSTLPWGKPTTVPTLTSLPRSISATLATSTGRRTVTEATSYSAAKRMLSSMNASSSSGRSNEWSIVLATSR